MAKTSIPVIDLQQLEILVAEDDPASRMMLARILEKSGAKVTVASDGSEGLQLFKQHHFPIVITDINMPIMSGIELVHEIKKIDPTIKAIATSALRDPEHFVAAITTGFSDYILKPLEIDKLLFAVKRSSELQAVETQLANEQEKFRTVVASLADGVSIKDLDYKIIYQNQAMKNMFGEHIGETCYIALGHSTYCPNCPTVEALNNGKHHLSCRPIIHNGKTIHIESSASVIRDSKGKISGTVEIIRDVSLRERNQAIMRELAFHDQLTGLANRRLFGDRLDQAFAAARRNHSSLAVIYLDLDHFKEVNDIYGHEAGDKLLILSAERLKCCCKRDVDTVSRHGGDEFCVIITDCGGREQLLPLVESILQAFSEPFPLAGQSINMSISIGLALFPDNASQPKELEIAADRAMYAAKKAGRNRYCFWDSFANK